MDEMKQLHELCETISEAIRGANEKIRAAGGKMTPGDVEYIDKLTHSFKSIKAVMAMMEEEGGYSGESSYDGSYRGSYRGGSYRGYSGEGSYARGRRNAPRDSMGRYSGERGYSRDGLADELRGMMQDAPDDQTRKEFERFISRIESM